MHEIITSLRNPKVRNLQKLRKPSERRQQKVILTEGLREIKAAVSAGFQADSVYYCQELMEQEKVVTVLGNALNNAQTFSVSQKVFSEIALRDNSDGLIVLFHEKLSTFDDIKLSKNPLLIVLESVEKPGNLGAVLRTADAAGVDAVLVCDPQTDIFNPNVVRASLGAVFLIPVVAASSQEVIRFLKQHAITSFATALTATHSCYHCDFTQASAIVMGAEATGLSELWLSEADEKILIPMRGKVDSLNVSAATAIVVFEALRQRLHTN